MRTEAEIRGKLKEIEARRDRKPSFWSVLVWDVYTECFTWVLAEQRGAFWKRHQRLPRRTKVSQK